MNRNILRIMEALLICCCATMAYALGTGSVTHTTKKAKNKHSAVLVTMGPLKVVRQPINYKNDPDSSMLVRGECSIQSLRFVIPSQERLINVNNLWISAALSQNHIGGGINAECRNMFAGMIVNELPYLEQELIYHHLLTDGILNNRIDITIIFE